MTAAFNCTGCGKCCTGAPGYVFVTPEEILAISVHLNLSLEVFVSQYVRLTEDGRFSLKERPPKPEYDCVFLQEKKCTIYQVRPRQCRTFPYWPAHMESEASWEEVKKECEGIHPLSKLPLLSEVPACHL